jgi:hypothetical protein
MEYTKGIFILFYSSYELILCVWLGEEGPLPFRESKGEVGMNERGGGGVVLNFFLKSLYSMVYRW